MKVINKPNKPIKQSIKIFRKNFTSCSLEELIKIANEYRLSYGEVFIEVNYEDDDYCEISVFSERIETDKEFSIRLKKYEEDLKAYEEWQEFNRKQKEESRLKKQEILNRLSEAEKEVLGINKKRNRL